MKIGYLHNLPLEYYPPACVSLDLLGRQGKARVHAFTTVNRKGRKAYANKAIEIFRSRAVDPGAIALARLVVAFWWHVKAAVGLWKFKPEAIIYVEPHSAIAAWIYFRLLRGKARLFIHHHEYYEAKDYDRPGMRMPRLGSRLEKSYLFPRAEWISQTNEDRLCLARSDHPGVSNTSWHILPNYPPSYWCKDPGGRLEMKERTLRLIYIGSASFEDTYIAEIVRWASTHPEAVHLHICGYNVAQDVWDWLREEHFTNITYDAKGYSYEELPNILKEHDVGLVLYKGNTTNFIYNVPNKVFEYLICGLEVWYPKEMTGVRHFCEQHDISLSEVNFDQLNELLLGDMIPVGSLSISQTEFTAEHALSPLFKKMGLSCLMHQ